VISSARILLTDCTNPHKNLAMEEAMLRSLPADQAILFLWQNRHTVVIGSGQNAWRECDAARMREEGAVLARRCTGGGAVYHDLGNLNFSFIVPRADYDVDRQLTVVMNAVRAHGLNAVKSGRNDLLVDGRKFSGNAFRVLTDSALHHGTLLISSDMSMVPRYLTPDEEKLRAKGVKSVSSRVMNLSEMGQVTVDSMSEAMVSAFQAEYGPARIGMADVSEFPLYEGLIPRYQSWEWNWGASPQGNMVLRQRFSWGAVEIHAEVTGGAVKNAQVYTDSMDETLALRLSGLLTGCPWRAEELKGRLVEAGEEEIAYWLSALV